MRNSNFIITQDFNTKNQLLSAGLTLLYENDGVFIFLNCVEKMSKFQSNSDCQFIYTNNLVI